MKSIVSRLWLLLLFSSLAGAAFNTFRPTSRLPWLPDKKAGDEWTQAKINALEFRELFDGGQAFFVDARPAQDFAKGHLSGAINIPSTRITEYEAIIHQRLPKGARLVIYCNGERCDASRAVFDFLKAIQYPLENLKVFEPGWDYIQRSEFPSEKGLNPWDPPL